MIIARPKKSLSLCLAVAVYVLSLWAPSIALALDPSRVLVVYNSSWTADEDLDGVQDSLQVAQYYLQKRGIPATNVLGVTCLTGAGPCDGAWNSYADLQTYFFSPLRAKLTQLGQTNIDLIVMSYRMPFVLGGADGYGNKSLDDMTIAPFYWSTTTNNVGKVPNPYFTANPSFSPDKGRFSHNFKVNNTPMYLVGRIDSAIDVGHALELVDQALYADRYYSNQPGYFNGTAYVNSRFGPYTESQLSADSYVKNGTYWTAGCPNGGYGCADRNVAYTGHHLTQAGVAVKWQNGATDIGAYRSVFTDGTSALTAHRAMLYAGWYKLSYNLWDWLPGSYANDLNSSSLNLRTSQCGGTPCERDQLAFRNGVSAVSGVINEPYVDGHPQSNTAIYYLLKGYTFAEASTLSYNYLGWMHISVGDPLMAPFAAKTPVKDYLQPKIVSGFPKMTTGANAADRVINIMVSDTLEPEVIKADVEYGIDTAYGARANSGAGYFRRQFVTLPNLLPATTYHFRLRLTDPSGNTTLTGDYTIDTADATNSIGGPNPPSPGSGGPLAVDLPQQTLEATSKIGAVIDVTFSGGTGNYAAAWSKISGPAAVTFEDANRPTAKVSFSSPGSYSLRVTVNDGVSSTSRDVVFNVINPTPALTATPGTLNWTGTPESTVTVNAPGNFRLIFTDRFGGPAAWYDLKNDPNADWQIAADGGLNYWNYNWSGGNAWPGTTAVSSWQLIENTPARVKLAYTVPVQGIPQTITYTVYPSGLVATEYKLTNTSSNSITFTDVRYQLNSLLRTAPTRMDDNYTFPTPGAQSWVQVHGDGITMPLFSAVEHLVQATNFEYNWLVWWQSSIGFGDNNGYTLPPGAIERAVINYTLQPDAGALNGDSTIDPYKDDFRNPAPLTFIIGSPKANDPGDVNADGYVESEAAYAMSAASGQVRFSIDGSAIPRHSPVLKVSNLSAAKLTIRKDSVQLIPGQQFLAAPINPSTWIIQVLGDVTSNVTFEITGDTGQPSDTLPPAPPQGFQLQ